MSLRVPPTAHRWMPPTNDNPYQPTTTTTSHKSRNTNPNPTWRSSRKLSSSSNTSPTPPLPKRNSQPPSIVPTYTNNHQQQLQQQQHHDNNSDPATGCYDTYYHTIDGITSGGSPEKPVNAPPLPARQYQQHNNAVTITGNNCGGVDTEYSYYSDDSGSTRLPYYEHEEEQDSDEDEAERALEDGDGEHMTLSHHHHVHHHHGDKRLSRGAVGACSCRNVSSDVKTTMYHLNDTRRIYPMDTVPITTQPYPITSNNPLTGSGSGAVRIGGVGGNNTLLRHHSMMTAPTATNTMTTSAAGTTTNTMVTRPRSSHSSAQMEHRVGGAVVLGCGGKCETFENVCYYLLQVAFAMGILIGASLCLAGAVLRKSAARNLQVLVYIGALVALVSALLLIVQCRARRAARYRRNQYVTQQQGNVTTATTTGTATLLQQSQGMVKQPRGYIAMDVLGNGRSNGGFGGGMRQPLVPQRGVPVTLVTGYPATLQVQQQPPAASNIDNSLWWRQQPL